MSLRACEGEAIQLLPIYKGRKWVEYKSPECPILVTKMSSNLHFLSKYLHSKVGLTLVNLFKIFGRLKSTLPAFIPTKYASCKMTEIGNLK